MGKDLPGIGPTGFLFIEPLWSFWSESDSSLAGGLQARLRRPGPCAAVADPLPSGCPWHVKTESDLLWHLQLLPSSVSAAVL